MRIQGRGRIVEIAGHCFVGEGYFDAAVHIGIDPGLPPNHRGVFLYRDRVEIRLEIKESTSHVPGVDHCIRQPFVRADVFSSLVIACRLSRTHGALLFISRLQLLLLPFL